MDVHIDEDFLHISNQTCQSLMATQPTANLAKSSGELVTRCLFIHSSSTPPRHSHRANWEMLTTLARIMPITLFDVDHYRLYELSRSYALISEAQPRPVVKKALRT